MLLHRLTAALVVTGLGSASGLAPQAAACEKHEKHKDQCPPGRTPPGAPTDPGDPSTCFGRPVNVVGTPGDDRLAGMLPGMTNVIAALGGDDSVVGDAAIVGGVQDFLCLGTGDDGGSGGNGDDVVDGGPGADRLDDIADARPGADTLLGSEGDDQIFEEDGAADIVDGGPGNDTCSGDAVDVFTHCEFVSQTP